MARSANEDTTRAATEIGKFPQPLEWTNLLGTTNSLNSVLNTAESESKQALSPSPTSARKRKLNFNASSEQTAHTNIAQINQHGTHAAYNHDSEAEVAEASSEEIQWHTAPPPRRQLISIPQSVPHARQRMQKHTTASSQSGSEEDTESAEWLDMNSLQQHHAQSGPTGERPDSLHPRVGRQNLATL